MDGSLQGKVRQNEARLAKLAGSPLANWTLSHLKVSKNARVLDLGCGTDMKRILKKIPQGSIVGFYEDPAFADWARKENKEAIDGGRAHVFYRQGEQIPFGANEFDAVVAIESLYGRPDLPLLFSEILRVLKPGGVFLVGNSVGGRGVLTQIREHLIPGMKAYTVDELASMLYRAGFVNPKFETRLGALWLSMEKRGVREVSYWDIAKPYVKKAGIAAGLTVFATAGLFIAYSLLRRKNKDKDGK